MRRSFGKAVVSIAAVSILATITAAPAVAASGDRLWLRRYNSGPSESDGTEALAVTPDGKTVVVTGFPSTIAYDAATGATKWSTETSFYATAVGTNADRVFVSGCTCLLAAYEASTGTPLWQKVYGGPEAGVDSASRLVVSGNGERVFITGFHPIWTPTGYDSEFVTTAVAADNGARLWTRRFDGPLDLDNDLAIDVATTADGGLVVVTGHSANNDGYAISMTIAYDGATGARLWVQRIGVGWGNGVAISPDGASVFITGLLDFKTIALDASTGGRLWTRRYAGPSDKPDLGYDVTVSPDGSDVLVTGESDDAFATIAYDASTGDRRWVKRYQGPGGYSRPVELSVTPDGSRVVVTGIDAILVGDTVSDYTFDFATAEYDVATGSREWLRRYEGPVGLRDFPVAIGTAPDSSAVFVTGWSKGPSSTDDYLTMAYGV